MQQNKKFTAIDTISKQVRTQDTSQDRSSNSNLFILQQLKQGKRPSQIASEFNIPKSSLQYHLDQLKDLGLISKIGYGVWEVIGDFDSDNFMQQTSSNTTHVALDNIQTSTKQVKADAILRKLKQDEVRGHAFMFVLRIPPNLRNWNNEKREQILEKLGIEYERLKIKGGGQRILYKRRKIWLTNKSIIVYEKSSYFSESAKGAKSLAIQKFISLIKSLERDLHADFSFHANREYHFKVSRQHYALVKNALAKQYDEEGKKLKVYTAKNKALWFIIDNSYNLHEAETVHAETADEDNKKVQAFFNSLKEKPLTTDFILESIWGLTRVQQMYAENIRTHINAVKNLDKSASELLELIKNLKGEHPERRVD